MVICKVDAVRKVKRWFENEDWDVKHVVVVVSTDIYIECADGLL